MVTKKKKSLKQHAKIPVTSMVHPVKQDGTTIAVARSHAEQEAIIAAMNECYEGKFHA